MRACTQEPGWFAPGEAEKAAKLLGMEFEEFKKLLIIDHASNPDVGNAPYLYAPRKINVDEGTEIRTYATQHTQGTCVFLKEDRCSIHEAKPFECKTVYACKPRWGGFRADIETMWIDAGAPLGMRPEAKDGR